MRNTVLICLGVLAVVLGAQGVVNSDTSYTVTTCSPDMLWPPNHKYVDVEVSVTPLYPNEPYAIDWQYSYMVVGVWSNQPDDAEGTGDGETTDDIVIKDVHTVQARAERDGTDTNGRTYTIKVKWELNCFCIWCKVRHYWWQGDDYCTVFVPHSKGK